MVYCSVVDQVNLNEEGEKVVNVEKAGVIFKDLMAGELKEELQLVCRVVRQNAFGAGLSIGEDLEQSTRVAGGWGLIPVDELICTDKEFERTNSFSFVIEGGMSQMRTEKERKIGEEVSPQKIYLYEKPADMSRADMLLILVGEKMKPFSMREDGYLNVVAVLNPIPNEHVHLRLLRRFGKNTGIGERLSNTIHTTSSQAYVKFRDELYVTLESGIFPHCNPKTQILISMSVKQFSGLPVACLLLGRNSELTSEVTFSLSKTPSNQPLIGETAIVALSEVPTNQSLHLFFTITLRPAPDYIEGGVLNAFLRLSTDGKFLENGSYQLKCFWKASGANRMDNSYYLKNAVANTTSNGDDFLVVHTTMGSSKHTQNADLNAILHWQSYPPGILSTKISSVIEVSFLSSFSTPHENNNIF